MRDPLKLHRVLPADDHEIALPCPSVMVTMVLLKVAATWATPTTTFFFSFLRAREADFPGVLVSAMGYFPVHFLFAGNRLGRTLARAGVGMGALAAHRVGPCGGAGPGSSPRSISQLDVHRHFAAQVALDQIVAVDHFADPG